MIKLDINDCSFAHLTFTVATLPCEMWSGILADCNSDRSDGKYCFIWRCHNHYDILTTRRLIHTSDNVSLSWPGLPSLQTPTGTSSEVELSTWLHITHHRHVMMVIWPTSCTVRLTHWQSLTDDNDDEAMLQCCANSFFSFQIELNSFQRTQKSSLMPLILQTSWPQIENLWK